MQYHSVIAYLVLWIRSAREVITKSFLTTIHLVSIDAYSDDSLYEIVYNIKATAKGENSTVNTRGNYICHDSLIKSCIFQTIT